LKVNTYNNQEIIENRVDIYYKEINIEIEGILTYLNENQRKIIGFNDDVKHVLNIKDIYYFDTVDKKSFAYLKEAVYQVQYSLYKLEAFKRKAIYNEQFNLILMFVWTSIAVIVLSQNYRL
jgi:DNA-binding LytR/AlgR family response regulator